MMLQQRVERVHTIFRPHPRVTISQSRVVTSSLRHTNLVKHAGVAMRRGHLTPLLIFTVSFISREPNAMPLQDTTTLLDFAYMTLFVILASTVK